MKTYTLKEFFFYTRMERKAGIFLCCMCCFVWLLPFLLPVFHYPVGPVDFTEARMVASSLKPAEQPIVAGGEAFVPNFRGHRNESPRQAELFAFDPNTASMDEFVRLGLSPRTAQSILNYREKGGQFRKSEDFKRIYTLRPADYERLEAYIQIPPKPSSSKYDDFAKKADNQEFATKGGFEEKPFASQNFTKKSATVLIDINTATLDDWQQIRGIGPGWAKRIVNYREKLGGFIAPQQVTETFGLPDSVFQKALPQMQVNAGIFRKINLNTATLEELKKHPYLSSFQATILFNYRQQHGNYTDFASVKKVKAGFKDEDWRRLEPYFSYE